MNAYILLIASTALGAGNLSFNRIYQSYAGLSVHASLLYMIFYGIFSSAVFWIGNGFCLEISAYSFAMANIGVQGVQTR